MCCPGRRRGTNASAISASSPKVDQQMAPQTVDSDAPPFAQPGKARDLAHANPVCIEIPVTVQGSRNIPPGAATAPVPQPFIEETRTVLAFEQGAVLRMSETTVTGQILILKNTRLNREAACRVVNYKARENVKGYVEVEFLEPAPGFWGIEFPAPHAGHSTPAAEPMKSVDAPRLSAPTPTLQSQQPAATAQKTGVPLLPDLLPADSQNKTVSAREPSPSSLFGWEPPSVQPVTAKPAVEPPLASEKTARPVGEQSRSAADPTSLSDLLDSLTPLGEQVLLGKNPAQGSSSPSLRKTPPPLPSAFPTIPGTPASNRPAERKSAELSLQLPGDTLGAGSPVKTPAHPTPDFELPTQSASSEPSFSSLPRKQQSAAVLGGPIFSAGESDLTSSPASGSKTWLIVGAIAVLVAAGSGFGYYRFHSRFHAPNAQTVAVTAPAPPPPSPHDVTAPVDATPDASASQPSPEPTNSLPTAAPAPTTSTTPAAEPAPPPAQEVTTHTATPPAATHATAAQPPPAPAPAVPQPTPRNQTPANLKMSSPSTSSTSRAPTDDAPSISGDVPGAIPSGVSGGIAGIAQPNSQTGPAATPDIGSPPAAIDKFRSAGLSRCCSKTKCSGRCCGGPGCG